MEIENLDIKKAFLCELNERQKRSFLAIEAQGFGYGIFVHVSTRIKNQHYYGTLSTLLLQVKSDRALFILPCPPSLGGYGFS
ncbi:MAG: hypothetical protein ACI976_000780 [Aureispira sp.]|jgi:hypothetical protein